ncbi:MAG TPA: TrmH family RNA methyltransferase [Candidatus Paceibacterota bacterium]|nr:TrmH family RNA methyltransferase [Candidatus Paceibacterota bacterium]
MELIVIAHDIRSVHNVGSIFRTADAAGVAKIYLCGITPSPVDRFRAVRPDFAKVALGAEKFVPWESAKTTAGVIKKLKAEGYEIFALEQSKRSVPYYDAARAMRAGARVAIILGNEVKGLPPSILRSADRILEIPMMGEKESLNVAVAFGVVAFGLRFGRGGDGAHTARGGNI